MSDYIYDPAWEHERARLTGLEANLDPGTTRILDELGIEPGWRCLEIGGGGGSIAAWMCARVAPDGRVVATDRDPRFLEAIDAPNLEVRRHDIVTDPIEADAFDLVHSRDVLEHIPERDEVLATMVRAAKPGGLVVVEDVDFAPTLYGDEGGFGVAPQTADLFARFWRAAPAIFGSKGVDITYGRKLPAKMIALGLEDVGADVRARLVRGGEGSMAVMKLSISHLRPALVSSGGFTEEEIDRALAAADDPAHHAFMPLHVAAWGRKPL